MENIIVKIGGFTNGMTIEQVTDSANNIIEFYKPIIKRIKSFTWDGDPFKNKGSLLDEERGTPACFTHALVLLKKQFPDVPFTAAKRYDQLEKLSSKFLNTTKHGSVEVGCEDTFGPIKVVGSMGSNEEPFLDARELNVITASPSINWEKLGCDNILFWKNLGFDVHYVTIGGGNVISKELEKMGDVLDMIWRIPTYRLSPTEGNPPDVVDFQFSTKDPSLSVI